MVEYKEVIHSLFLYVTLVLSGEMSNNYQSTLRGYPLIISISNPFSVDCSCDSAFLAFHYGNVRQYQSTIRLQQTFRFPLH